MLSLVAFSCSEKAGRYFYAICYYCHTIRFIISAGNLVTKLHIPQFTLPGVFNMLSFAVVKNVAYDFLWAWRLHFNALAFY